MALYLVTLFDHKLLIFKNSPKLTNFGIFNELLSAHNINVALLAILNETFSVIFKHRGEEGCISSIYIPTKLEKEKCSICASLACS